MLTIVWDKLQFTSFPDGTKVRISDKGNEVYIIKGRRWVPEIIWTNCAEQMPLEFLTDNTKLIVMTLRGNIKCMSVNSLIDYMSELFITEHNIPFESCTRIVTYTEFTQEKWKELNKLP